MLRVEDLEVGYGDLVALQGVSLEAREGEVVAVVGSNGAGKTTTLRAISGLLRPRRGRISFQGTPLEKMGPARIVRLGLSHVPEGRQLFPNLTVQENLDLGAQSPQTRARRQKTLEEVFAYFPRLKERLQQKAGTLSGGEQQMVAIGRGLMARPRLLMLDEPSLGLAPILVSTIFEIVRRINQRGTTVLLVEQNVYHALELCHRAYILENGRLVKSGRGKELLADPHIRRTYLGL